MIGYVPIGLLGPALAVLSMPVASSCSLLALVSMPFLELPADQGVSGNMVLVIVQFPQRLSRSPFFVLLARSLVRSGVARAHLRSP